MTRTITEYAPYGAEQISFFGNFYQPSTTNYLNNYMYKYFERALFQRALSNMKFNLPSEWDGSTRDFILYCLFRLGYVAVFKTTEYGLVARPCSLNGFNLYYQPTEVIITNPSLSSVGRLQIGVDCELLKLTPDYVGIWDIVQHHAVKLALLSASFDMAAINSRAAFIVGAKNKTAAAAVKVIEDKVAAGQSLVVFEKEVSPEVQGEDPFYFLDRKNIKEAYMGEELLNDMQSILNRFDNEIGIPAMSMEKKERLLTDEIMLHRTSSSARCTIWEDCFNSSAELVNAKYGTDISVEMRWKGEKFDVGENDDSGDVQGTSDTIRRNDTAERS